MGIRSTEVVGVRHNKSFDTDAQVCPCALRTRFVCAGQVRR
jgi:hypothetical protein